MSRLFQRRTEFDELKRVLGRLNSTDIQTRLAVGAGVHLANAEFIRRFGGIEPFRRMPAEEQRRFAAVLGDLEVANDVYGESTGHTYVALASSHSTGIRHYPYAGSGELARTWVTVRTVDLLRRRLLTYLAEKK